MRIAIDIDSTLHHYWDLFAVLARKRFGINLPYEDQVTYDDVAPLRREQIVALIQETHRTENILAAAPYEGAVDAVRGWHVAGHFIHVTSHRAPETHAPTAAWLNQIGLPFDELYCSYDKITRCSEIAIDVLIDDSPQNILRALECGIVPATLAHPWNRELCQEEGVICARDWGELGERLAPVLAAGTSASRSA